MENMSTEIQAVLNQDFKLGLKAAHRIQGSLR